jgi:hypothetical protein
MWRKFLRFAMLLVLLAASIAIFWFDRNGWRVPLFLGERASRAMSWPGFEHLHQFAAATEPAAAPAAPTPVAEKEEEWPPQVQIDQYNADAPKTIIELQQFRRLTVAKIHDKNHRPGVAGLINLNPTVNAWHLLRLEWNDHQDGGVYHIENARPEKQHIQLDPENPYGLVIVNGGGPVACDLWSGEAKGSLAAAAAAGTPYAPLCGNRLYLRNKTKGHKTNKEWVTDLLRDYVWHGEKIVTFIREKFYKDAYLQMGKVALTDETPEPAVDTAWKDEPAPALIAPKFQGATIVPEALGLPLEDAKDNKLTPGRWYKVSGTPGVYLSAIRPEMVSEEVIKGQKKLVRALDAVEEKALVYLVAFDLDQFDVGYAMGTEHPRLEWSDRIPPNMHNNKLPGPDGIATADPVVNTGMLNPVNADRAVATFVGGFKRYHGAFRHGAFAAKNHGSHYGFVENGVVMSKLWPGLATFVTWEDGRIELKTWTAEDNEELAKVRHARQNGVPIIDFNPKTFFSTVGSLVNNWPDGNWSGSQDKKYRTLRGSLAWQVNGEANYLIYGYFSSATPSALARVYQAYDVKYAMLLDMNALEYTYLAIYPESGKKFAVKHLITGMNVLDKAGTGSAILPRFVGFSDARDFFYVLERTSK